MSKIIKPKQQPQQRHTVETKTDLVKHIHGVKHIRSTCHVTPDWPRIKDVIYKQYRKGQLATDLDDDGVRKLLDKEFNK